MTTTNVTASEVTAELRVPLAVQQWRAEQGLPPIEAAGRHDRDAMRARTLPEGWPFEPLPPLPELACEGLFYDQFGVIRPRKSSRFRRHAARHSAVAT